MVISILLMFAYIMCSAFGLILIKVGLNNKVVFSFASSCVEIKIPVILLGGAALYVCSFLLNMLMVSRFNLSYVYPISAGMIYIAIVVLSILMLKESVTNTQVIGMAAILIGIIVMNIGK